MVYIYDRKYKDRLYLNIKIMRSLYTTARVAYIITEDAPRGPPPPPTPVPSLFLPSCALRCFGMDAACSSVCFGCLEPPMLTQHRSDGCCCKVSIMSTKERRCEEIWTKKSSSAVYLVERCTTYCCCCCCTLNPTWKTHLSFAEGLLEVGVTTVRFQVLADRVKMSLHIEDKILDPLLAIYQVHLSKPIHIYIWAWFA